MHPILLVGIDLPNFNSSPSQKKISIEKIREISEEMKILRYFEVKTKEDSVEVFHEAARISVRELNANFKVETIERLHQACEKKLPSLDLRKRGIILLPSVIYYLCHFLQKIRLDNNFIRFFPMEILAFTNLQEISLAMNQIEEIPWEISKLTSLIKLDLENNLIEDLPILSVILLFYYYYYYLLLFITIMILLFKLFFILLLRCFYYNLFKSLIIININLIS